MGWRSWNAFHTDISQNNILQAGEALIARNRTIAGHPGKVSLCDLGYCSVGVDEGWEDCTAGAPPSRQHDQAGLPTIDPKFPDMAGMVQKLQDLGLSAGWYLNGCKCGEHVELEKNYEGDIRSLSKFGFDSVKIDGCGQQRNMTHYAELMKATGKSYHIENCHWGHCTNSDNSSCPTKDWCPFNWYRTSGDINTGSMSWFDNLQTARRFLDWQEPLSVPGCWAYPDMLEVGNVVEPSEGTWAVWNRAHFGAWCIISAPLILGLVLSDDRLETVLDFIGNKEAIAVNQAWAGHPGLLVDEIEDQERGNRPHTQNTGDQLVGANTELGGRNTSVERLVRQTPTSTSAVLSQRVRYESTGGRIMARGLSGQLWAKPQPGGGAAILLINTSPKSLAYFLALSKVNLTAPSYAVRDIWARRSHEASPVTTAIALSVAPYDSAFLLFTPIVVLER